MKNSFRQTHLNSLNSGEILRSISIEKDIKRNIQMEFENNQRIPVVSNVRQNGSEIGFLVISQ